MFVISSRGCAGAHCRRLWQNLQTSHRTFAVSWLSFGTLINNISQRENMIDTSPSSPKTYLSLGSLRSAASDRRFMVTFAKILLGVDNSVIPRQLLYSDRVPFFGILMMIPWFKRRFLSGALWFFRELMKAVISTLRSSSASGISGSSSGAWSV